MKTFSTLNRLFQKYLPAFVLVTAVIALIKPGPFVWIAGIVPYMLQFIMFTMGMTMKPSDFSEISRRPWRVLLVTGLQFTVMPLTAYLLSILFKLPSEIALGLILVGSVPGGTSSNIMAYLAKGDVPLSVTATSVSTLLSPFMTPVLLSFYGGAFVPVEFWPMFLSIIQIVLLPIIGGLIISRLLGAYTEKIKDTLPSLSTLAVLGVLAGTVSVNQELLVSTGIGIFFVVALHNLSGYLFGYIVCYLTDQTYTVTRAVAIEVGMQNTGLAASLGMQHFTPAAALAGAAGVLIHNLIGTLFANFVSRRDVDLNMTLRTQTDAQKVPALTKAYARQSVR
ncbi:bile acid:sodium symporter family protein [Dolosicoccus paucivorans]|uniref:bile acid:sodium symporter family protein n=1 Tax=Dolosicoccus paucivorans TaxID=84521 RepID=UPI000886AE7A|nr:bile acid:sodium symporter family protein [Dolosicoccus paucivorans]SDI17846.1 bile acid:Na+ symporter, BASS family [Dolosicoccus paucivorans]